MKIREQERREEWRGGKGGHDRMDDASMLDLPQLSRYRDVPRPADGRNLILSDHLWPMANPHMGYGRGEKGPPRTSPHSLQRACSRARCDERSDKSLGHASLHPIAEPGRARELRTGCSQRPFLRKNHQGKICPSGYLLIPVRRLKKHPREGRVSSSALETSARARFSCRMIGRRSIWKSRLLLVSLCGQETESSRIRGERGKQNPSARRQG